MNYQRHIDGLRAIAVLAVVADHLGYRSLHGGFVGVDVFFVISGYLITGIIVEDLARSRFTIRAFYERRVRRILPALVVMLTAVLAVGWATMFPSEFKDLSISGLAALFSVANVWFWSNVGYFDGPAGEKPLLHTWSLGVEEQFYLLFPLVVMALFKRRGRDLAKTLWIATAVLFVMAAVWTTQDASSAFYLLPARAWELCLGASLAVTRGQPKLPAWLLTVAGLAGIVVPIFAYGHGTPFPGLAALPVCLGTGALLLLRDHPDSLGARLLGCAPASFFGKISYSLYLWHWPVIVLQNVSNVLPLPDFGVDRLAWHLERATMFGISVALATLSYYLVETPFRKATLGGIRRTVQVTLAGVGVIAAGFAVVVMTGGVANRFPAKAVGYEAYLKYDASPWRKPGCMLSGDRALSRFPADRCIAFDAAKPNVLIMGDSHAEHLYPGLAASMPEVNVMQATATGCRPVMNQPDRDGFVGCRALAAHLYNDVLPKRRPDLLLLSGHWSEDDLPRLKPTLLHLKTLGVRTLLVGPTTDYDTALPRLLAREVVSGEAGFAQSRVVRSRFDMDKRMAALAAETGTEYFSTLALLCPDGQCIQVIDDVPVAFDYSHYTLQGSTLVGRALAERFRAPAR